MNALIKRWENIKNIQGKEKAPFCVERNNGIIRKIIIDTIVPNIKPDITASLFLSFLYLY